MKPTAKYLKYLFQRRHRIHKGPQDAKNREILNNTDYDLDAKPPEELSAFEIAHYKLIGPPVKFAGK